MLNGPLNCTPLALLDQILPCIYWGQIKWSPLQCTRTQYICMSTYLVDMCLCQYSCTQPLFQSTGLHTKQCTVCPTQTYSCQGNKLHLWAAASLYHHTASLWSSYLIGQPGLLLVRSWSCSWDVVLRQRLLPVKCKILSKCSKTCHLRSLFWTAIWLVWPLFKVISS